LRKVQKDNIAILIGGDFLTTKLQIYFYGMILGALLMIVPAYNYFFLFGVVYEFFELLRYLGIIFFIMCGIPIAITVIKTLLNK
jgi:hypothetical protein